MRAVASSTPRWFRNTPLSLADVARFRYFGRIWSTERLVRLTSGNSDQPTMPNFTGNIRWLATATFSREVGIPHFCSQWTT